jgi:hypothetical protein
VKCWSETTSGGEAENLIVLEKLTLDLFKSFAIEVEGLLNLYDVISFIANNKAFHLFQMEELLATVAL